MSDPYVIDGPAQICFSGGRTKGYMLHQILEANGGLPDVCIVSYQNTEKEREETIDRPTRSCSAKQRSTRTRFRSTSNRRKATKHWSTTCAATDLI
jgi:hypothetical protein